MRRVAASVVLVLALLALALVPAQAWHAQTSVTVVIGGMALVMPAGSSLVMPAGSSLVH